MSQFWKVRIATLIWGFGVTYSFTGSLSFTGKIYLIILLGNTTMWYLFFRKLIIK